MSERPGLDFSADTFYELMSVSREAGVAEAQAHEALFDRFLDRLPKGLIFERELLKSRLWRSPERAGPSNPNATNSPGRVDAAPLSSPAPPPR
jgi:hypothetical protein